MLLEIFKKHHGFVLVGITILFLAVISLSFAWGASTLVSHLNKVVDTGEGAAGVTVFDIDGAAALDLKGLVK